jgi:hypothetical protein
MQQLLELVAEARALAGDHPCKPAGPPMGNRRRPARCIGAPGAAPTITASQAAPARPTAPAAASRSEAEIRPGAADGSAAAPIAAPGAF